MATWSLSALRDRQCPPPLRSLSLALPSTGDSPPVRRTRELETLSPPDLSLSQPPLVFLKSFSAPSYTQQAGENLVSTYFYGASSQRALGLSAFGNVPFPWSLTITQHSHVASRSLGVFLPPLKSDLSWLQLPHLGLAQNEVSSLSSDLQGAVVLQASLAIYWPGACERGVPVVKRSSH